MIAFLLGAFVGSLLLCAIISWIVERFAFRADPPMARALKTIGIAWLVIGTIAGFGMADGGPFRVAAFVYYLPGCFAYFVWYKSRLDRAWAEDDTVDRFA